MDVGNGRSDDPNGGGLAKRQHRCYWTIDGQFCESWGADVPADVSLQVVLVNLNKRRALPDYTFYDGSHLRPSHLLTFFFTVHVRFCIS